jgi:ubiquinol-cytochrome c reductase iron-sulfur subunit
MCRGVQLTCRGDIALILAKTLAPGEQRMRPMSAAVGLHPANEASTATRRDFLTLSAVSFAAVGAAAGLWPVVDSLNPSARERADDAAARIDPARDRTRVRRKQWLVVVGVCTHLGCAPTSRAAGDLVPRFGGWVCPCHYSQFDISGRVRRGPAPRNLPVPPNAFRDDDTLVIG